MSMPMTHDSGQPAEGREAAALLAIGPEAKARVRILVVDDEHTLRESCAAVLRHEGYDVTVSARNRERLEAAAAELGAESIAGDVAREEDCEQIVTQHRARFERLDVLVNCAGVGVAARIEELETKHWDLQVNVNLRGAFLVTRFALPLLKEARGIVVNISSIAGTMAAPGLPLVTAKTLRSSPLLIWSMVRIWWTQCAAVAACAGSVRRSGRLGRMPSKVMPLMSAPASSL